MKMESTIEKIENFTVCEHPVISDNLAVLRDKNTNSESFRRSTQKISQMLFYKATENLPLKSNSVETPLMPAQVDVICPDAEIIIAPILRAGLMFSDTALDILPQSKVHHIGLYRDEKTLQPVAYYNNLPKAFKIPEKTFVYLLDPMLATGGSAVAAVKLFTDLHIPQKNITFVSLISAPEGVNKLAESFDEVRIITASLDKGLNSSGYILPGLGDAGDRTFNTSH
jgi:uracil phosphoribosyltransferase